MFYMWTPLHLICKWTAELQLRALCLGWSSRRMSKHICMYSSPYIATAKEQRKGGSRKSMLTLNLWKLNHKQVNPGEFTRGACKINRSKDKCLSARTFCSRNTTKINAVLQLSLPPSEMVRMEGRSRRAVVPYPQNMAVS